MTYKIRRKFIGDRNFYKVVLSVAVPIMVQNGITNFVGLLDNIMVGRLGTEQMSGVSIVNQLVFVYNLCIFGGLAGAGIFTAQYFGQKDHEGIRHTFRYKIWLGLVVMSAALLLFLIWGENLIWLYLNGSGDGGNLRLAQLCGMNYLHMVLLGIPPFMLLQVYASTLRECGETVVPMRAGGKTGITFLYDCVCIWGISVPLAFVLSRYTGIPAWMIYALVQAGEWTKCIFGFVMVKKGVWLRNIVSGSR